MTTETMHATESFELVDFGDKRLTKRLAQLVKTLSGKAHDSILGATLSTNGGGRSEAKACYRLLGNPKVDWGKVADSIRDTTIGRMHGTVLLIEDTTDVNLSGHGKTEGLGYSSANVLGVKVHSCIAVTPEGMSLGLVAQQCDTRPESKSMLTKAEKAARPIEEKESYRWLKMIGESTRHIPQEVHPVTVCDREGDFYELYVQAAQLGQDFVIRAVRDRLTEVQDEKALAKIRGTEAVGQVTVNIPRDTRNNAPARQAEMEVAHCRVNILKPASVRDATLPASLEMTLVRITESDGKGSIEWILATSLPVNGAEDAMTVVEYYVQRWKIERYHFVLKSGCNVEKIQQRTFGKVKSMLLVYSVIAMHIMAVTYMGRILPDTPCDVFFDEDEWKILYRICNRTKTPPEEPYSMEDAVKYLGQLGSYKRAPSDGPPGLKAIWAGLFKLYEYMELFMGQD